MAETKERGGGVCALEMATVESSLQLPQGHVAVREYNSVCPTTNSWTPQSHLLDLALSSRPQPAWARFEEAPATRHALGRVIFLPAGQTLQTGAAMGRFRSMSCVLSTSVVDGLLKRGPTWDKAALAEGLQLQGAEIEWLLLKIYRELRDAGFGAQVMVESLLNALAVAIIRRFRLHEAVVTGPSMGGLSPWRLRRIRERVLADEPAPSLDDLAELCGMSVRHLSRAFKAEVGQTIASYVQAATVERARRLLEASDLPMSEIARRLGFSSSASFAYAFRRATGVRPSDVEGRRRARVRRQELTQAAAVS